MEFIKVELILTETKEGQGKDSIQVGLNSGSHHKQQANIQLQGGSEQANQPAYVISFLLILRPMVLRP